MQNVVSYCEFDARENIFILVDLQIVTYKLICICCDIKIWASGCLLEVIKLEKFKSLVFKVIAVTYKRWSLLRDFDYSDLTGRNVVLWLTRGSHTWRLDCK